MINNQPPKRQHLSPAVQIIANVKSETASEQAAMLILFDQAGAERLLDGVLAYNEKGQAMKNDAEVTKEITIDQALEQAAQVRVENTGYILPVIQLIETEITVDMQNQNDDLPMRAVWYRVIKGKWIDFTATLIKYENGVATYTIEMC